MKKILFIIGICICLAGVGYSAYMLFDARQIYEVASTEYDDLRQEVVTEEEPLDTTPEKPVKRLLNIKWNKLQKINADIWGWIKLPESPIDYPICDGVDNDFYLHHTSEKTESISGSIFSDVRNAKEKDHLILYGHTMKDGSMFHCVREFDSQEYYEQHKSFIIASPDGDAEYAIYSAYITNDSSNVYEVYLDSAEKYFNSAKSQSLIQTDIEYTPDTQLVTLSTCTGDGSTDRFVVQAIKIGD